MKIFLVVKGRKFFINITSCASLNLLKLSESITKSLKRFISVISTTTVLHHGEEEGDEI